MSMPTTTTVSSTVRALRRPTDLSGTVTINHTGQLPFLAFTNEANRRGLVHLVRRELPAAHTADALPVEADLLLVIDSKGGQDHVAVLDGCVIWLDSWSNGGQALVAGPGLDAAHEVTRLLLARVAPQIAPGQVRVEFADRSLGSRHLGMDVREWPDIAHLYPPPVASAMPVLIDHQVSDDDPRLLLWHGRPGTGKTTAVRCLRTLRT